MEAPSSWGGRLGVSCAIVLVLWAGARRRVPDATGFRPVVPARA